MRVSDWSRKRSPQKLQRIICNCRSPRARHPLRTHVRHQHAGGRYCSDACSHRRGRLAASGRGSRPRWSPPQGHSCHRRRAWPGAPTRGRGRRRWIARARASRPAADALRRLQRPVSCQWEGLFVERRGLTSVTPNHCDPETLNPPSPKDSETLYTLKHFYKTQPRNAIPKLIPDPSVF
jgi:hypothetical protein